MVIGETQIFGQLKQAYKTAREAKPLAKFSSNYFPKYFNCKKNTLQSSLYRISNSLGGVIRQISRDICQARTQVLFIGAGEMCHDTFLFE